MKSQVSTILVLAVFATFSSVNAMNENYTLEQNLIEAFETNGYKLLNNVTTELTSLQRDGFAHLSGLLEHHADALRRGLLYLNTTFPMVDIAKVLGNNHMVHSLTIDLNYVDEQIGAETQIARQVMAAAKRVQQPNSSVDKSAVIGRLKAVLERANTSMVTRPNSREFDTLEWTVQEVHRLINHLHDETDPKRLTQAEQQTAQLEMSVQVLAEKAQWRLRCHKDCHPTANQTLLAIDEPAAVLHMMELLQTFVQTYERSINETLTVMANLTKAGHGNLTSALAYLVDEMVEARANVQAQLDEADPVYSVHFIGVVMEDNLRLDFRVSEEKKLIEHVIRAGADKHESHVQLVNRARLLVRLFEGHCAKHPHYTQVPQIRDELSHLQTVVQLLADPNTPKTDVALNAAIEMRLNRHQTTVQQLTDWDIKKF